MRLITCNECGDEQPDYIMEHGLCPCCRGAVVDEDDLYSDSHITDTAKVIQQASGRISGKRYYDGPLP